MRPRLGHGHHLDPGHVLDHSLLARREVRHLARDIHDLEDCLFDRNGVGAVLGLEVGMRFRHAHLFGLRPYHRHRLRTYLLPVLDMCLRHRYLLVHESRDRDSPRLILGPVARLGVRHRHLVGFRVVDRLVDGFGFGLVRRRRSGRRRCRRRRAGGCALGLRGRICQGECQRNRQRRARCDAQIDLGCSISVSSIRLSNQSCRHVRLQFDVSTQLARGIRKFA